MINRLQQSHALVIQIADNLTSYMTSVRSGGEAVSQLDPNQFSPDGRYSHTMQVNTRFSLVHTNNTHL